MNKEYTKEKPYTVLIGDDVLEHNGMDDTIATNVSCAMLDVFPDAKPISIKRKGDDVLAVFPSFPHCVQYSFAKTSEEFLDKAKNEYDWKVTDLNYGRGLETEGQRLVREISGRNVAICTSEDDVLLLENLVAQHVISPTLEGKTDHKFDLLGQKIAEEIKRNTY